jgi:diadenosine tetraphosphate (Ap4A) HIT family hydrolase
MIPTMKVMRADNHIPLGFPRCEFCDELVNPHFSRFGEIYGERYAHRIVAEGDGFLALPTIGQLFKGSLLVMPRGHFETISELPISMIKALIPILELLESRIMPFGIPILFEHGAKCKTGAGCGIYHAHLHLVPVPGDIRCADVLPDMKWVATTLFEAYDRVRDSEHYLLFRDITGQFAAIEPRDNPTSHFHSQYFRRVLANHFGLKAPWDWRQYNRQETWLIETLNWFEVEGVSFR